jgi:tRNA 5-methylaminomethyl-2-thiouridine biosynthesis bifunctional protein
VAKSYDTIVIGAGIAGCCTAWFLQEKGVDVLLIDRSGFAASGGSGAAGAFVSPKIGKGSTLQKLTNEAFDFAKDFYLEHFSDHFSQTGVIRIPKDEEDAQKFTLYESFNDAEYRWMDAGELHSLGIREELRSFYFPEAGVCDAVSLCSAIYAKVPHKQFDVANLEREGGRWRVQPKGNGIELSAKRIVVATGYQNDLFDMRYMGVRGTWGSRGDYFSGLDLKVSMHKSISVSANIDGIIKLGATHVKSKNPCMQCDGEPLAELFKKASDMVESSDFRLKETYCGMRSGSRDYFPLVGRVIDAEAMLLKYPALVRGAKPPLEYLEELYICNGLGGRGFVFAPLMAKNLAEHIIEKRETDKRVDPDRLFLKWCRRSEEAARTIHSLS